MEAHEFTFQFFGGSDCGFGILRGILTRVCRLWSGTYIDVRSRASGFSADVKDVGTLVQQTLGLLERLVAIEVSATVGEGIRGEVDDAHDQRALAEFQRACAQVPVEDGPHPGTILT